MRRSIFILLVAVAVGILACTTIEETGESRFMLISPKQEMQMGLTAFQDIKASKKISTDAQANAQVQRVVARLTPVVDYGPDRWEVVVFDDPSPNAFALPGGKMGCIPASCLSPKTTQAWPQCSDMKWPTSRSATEDNVFHASLPPLLASQPWTQVSP